MKHILLALCLAVAVSSCAAWSLLPNITGAVVDGTQILEAIDDFTEKYFQKRPNKVEQEKVREAIRACRMSLNNAMRTAQTAPDLTNDIVDHSFDSFRREYGKLLELVGAYGVTASSDAIVTTPGIMLQVPRPLALTLTSRNAK